VSTVRTKKKCRNIPTGYYYPGIKSEVGMGSWRNLFVGMVFYMAGSVYLRRSSEGEDNAGILLSLTGMTVGLLIAIRPQKMP
jgi:hypothetical protein